MGFLNWIGLGKDLAEPINAVGNLYTTDKERLEAEAKLQDELQKRPLAQLENNKLLILSGKLFNLGWIPCLGWTCGFLILLYYAPQIIIISWVWGGHCISSGQISPFPMPSEEILNLVYLLFGMGGLGIVKHKIN